MSNAASTTFIILAGGIGKRLHPFTIDKTLIPVCGKPLIEHTLEQIARIGGRKVIMVTNERNHHWATEYSHPQLSIQLVQQPQADGMGGAVLAATENKVNSPVIIMNEVDQVSDSLFADVFSKATAGNFLITGIEQTEYFPGGYLQLDQDRVVSIVEKPAEGTQPSNFVNLVFHYFSQLQPFIEILKQTDLSTDDQYERALATLMKEQQVLFVPYRDYWQALKYPHMLLDVAELYLEQRLQPTNLAQDQAELQLSISPQATISGPVQFGRSVTVEAGAVIKGPAYIGDNVTIGTNSLVRSSIIESNCIIGFGSEVARSYLGPNCALHHNFIGDSVLEGNCNPSWGTCFANWRFDNQPVALSYPSGKIKSNRPKLGAIVGNNGFFGVNCSIMPGSVVAPDTQVYPGLVVKGQLEGVIKTNTV